MCQDPAPGGGDIAGHGSALRIGGAERFGQDHAAEDAGQPQPARAGTHLHPARGAGGGWRRDGCTPERP